MRFSLCKCDDGLPLNQWFINQAEDNGDSLALRDQKIIVQIVCTEQLESDKGEVTSEEPFP